MELTKLLLMLENDIHVYTGGENLFGIEDEPSDSRRIELDDINFLTCYFSNGFNPSALDEKARDLFELSINAFDAIVHAWMSELQIEAEIISYGRRVIAAAENIGGAEERRLAAERAACDRTCADTLTVMNTAYKVQHEAHRMMGLLRFSPDEQGCYTARCAPDHFILPALGEYFTSRFGETEWAIIDEKRGMSLSRENGKQAKIIVRHEPSAVGGDEWENLWRHYHKTINNESRNNPGLQRQFMPKRYWKYLPEAPNYAE
ncbi:MAG: TIGR03915 family putative DNA repair protein [Treponema sp.]|jgi:probable DNA metabolism protein|nr:TIGR03915 family putative DNA repair protein [Treponema sp.]